MIVRGLGLDESRRRSLARTDLVIALANEAGLAVATPRAHAERGGAHFYSTDDEVIRFMGDLVRAARRGT